MYNYSDDQGLYDLIYFSQILQASIPLSFSYYPSNKFGIGFLYSPGFNLDLVSFINPFYFNISNELKIHIKAGDINNKYLLIENGGILLIRFPSGYGSGLYRNINLIGGANLLIGFEKKFNEHYCFTVGGIIEILFGGDYNDYSNEQYEEYKLIAPSMGIEFRWRFYYNKELNKK